MLMISYNVYLIPGNVSGQSRIWTSKHLHMKQACEPLHHRVTGNIKYYYDVIDCIFWMNLWYYVLSSLQWKYDMGTHICACVCLKNVCCNNVFCSMWIVHVHVRNLDHMRFVEYIYGMIKCMLSIVGVHSVGWRW